MASRILIITSPDTGVGKTLLTTLLVQALRDSGQMIAALKPICSGGRRDAKILHAAMAGELTLDEINPWHFRVAVAPLLAARNEHRSITLREVVDHIRLFQRRFETLVIEGAGGLLSPLGERFSTKDLILTTRAIPIVVASNRLGAVNQVLLVLSALPKSSRQRARVVLMGPKKPDASCPFNAALLAESIGHENVFLLPYLAPSSKTPSAPLTPILRRLLHALLASLVPQPKGCTGHRERFATERRRHAAS